MAAAPAGKTPGADEKKSERSKKEKKEPPKEKKEDPDENKSVGKSSRGGPADKMSQRSKKSNGSKLNLQPVPMVNE